MKRWIPLISISAWLVLAVLAACGPTPYPPTSYIITPNAAATLAAVDQVRNEAANNATVQAAEVARQSALATQQVVVLTQQAQATEQVLAAQATGTIETILQAQTATAASVVIRITEQAIQAQATREAIAAQATGTAVAQLAAAEQRLIDDEQQRLALQRQAEAAELEYQRQMNQIRPYLWGGVVVTAIMTAAAAILILYQRSRPITVHDSTGPRVLVPLNSYQVLPSPRPALAASVTPIETTPDSTMTPIPLPPLTQGHVLIAGETGSGKSTALLAVLRRRPNVVVLDPHDDSATWENARVIGGGRNFAAIETYLEQMKQLLSQRYQQRSQGQRQFESLTVATDEMPAIVSALGRGVDEVWRMWLREGRKVGLYFIVSTQSTRVKTLGIQGEGDLLENFSYVLVLGRLAVTTYPELVQEMERPAVIRTINGVRPVLIPYESQTRERPIAPAPGATGELIPDLIPDGYADPNNLTEATRQRIRHLSRELPSQAAIERAVFGYNGGAAYRAVKETLNGIHVTSENGQQ